MIGSNVWCRSPLPSTMITDEVGSRMSHAATGMTMSCVLRDRSAPSPDVPPADFGRQMKRPLEQPLQLPSVRRSRQQTDILQRRRILFVRAIQVTAFLQFFFIGKVPGAVDPTGRSRVVRAVCRE